MIIDCNAFCGPYPFRQLRYHSVDAILGLMDRNGLDGAILQSLTSVFYRDAHRGNEELYQATRSHPTRFLTVCTLNPKYVGWEDDLKQAVEQWGMKAVALYPSHHGYQWNDPFVADAIGKIVEYDLPLVLVQRLEDRRQRHAWDAAEDLDLRSVLDLATGNPRLRIFFCNWNSLDGTKLANAGLRGRCLIDFSRLQVLLNRDVFKLMDSLGVESIAFGSHLPFDYVGPSLVKLSILESMEPRDLEKIRSGNAISFFRWSRS
ncbi:MAG: hypothetical protein KGQ60_09380 [Planctomycetes bacterium]|nr:hypothetical protein [Planctomycetota bacterium]